MLSNQKIISDLSKELYKKLQKGHEFKRKPLGSRNPAVKKIMMESAKELQIETNALTQGISEKSARMRHTFWTWVKNILACGFVFLLFKNQIWPFVRDYVPFKLF